MKVYVCSPLGAATQSEIQKNIRYAERCGDLLKYFGHDPVIPHILARFFDDNNKLERQLCMNKAILALRNVDLMIVNKQRITSGMWMEIEECQMLNIPVLGFDNFNDLLNLCATL